MLTKILLFQNIILLMNNRLINSDIVIGNKIIGGKAAIIREYPFIVSINYHDEHICGGSIVNIKTVISAAHCFYPNILNPISISKYYFVKAAITSLDEPGRQFQFDKVIEHPQYNNNNFTYDLIIIKIKGQFQYDTEIQPLELPDRNFPLIPGYQATVMGWGVMEVDGPISNTLQTVNVQIMNRTICNEYYRNHLDEHMFCAGDLTGEHDACTGDSGGPLVYNKTILIGVVSWGNSCGLPGYPGVYTNIVDCLEFIYNYL